MVDRPARDRPNDRWHMTEDDEALHEFAADQRSRNLSENTIRNYRSILDTLRAVNGSILDATTRDLRHFVGRPGLAPGSRRVNQAALRSFFTFACDEGYRDDNPTDRL